MEEVDLAHAVVLFPTWVQGVVLVLGERGVDVLFQQISRVVGRLYPYRDEKVDLDLAHLYQGSLDLEVSYQEVHLDLPENVASWPFLTANCSAVSVSSVGRPSE